MTRAIPKRKYSRNVAVLKNIMRTNSMIPAVEKIRMKAMLRCGFMPADLARFMFVKRTVVYNYCLGWGYGEKYRSELDFELKGLPDNTLLDEAWLLEPSEIIQKYLYRPRASASAKNHLVVVSPIGEDAQLGVPVNNLILDSDGNLDKDKVELSNAQLANKMLRSANRIVDSISSMTDKQLAKESLADKSKALTLLVDRAKAITRGDPLLDDINKSTIDLITLISRSIPKRKKDIIDFDNMSEAIVVDSEPKVNKAKGKKHDKED